MNATRPFPEFEKPLFDDAGHSCTMPARYYTDPGICEQEKRAIFARTRHYIGHESQLPGDMTTGAEDPRSAAASVIASPAPSRPGTPNVGAAVSRVRGRIPRSRERDGPADDSLRCRRREVATVSGTDDPRLRTRRQRSSGGAMLRYRR